MKSVLTLVLMVLAAALGAFPSATYAQTQVGLYDVFEASVTNSNSYSNKFDFRVIELQTTFTPPSGSPKTFFGFYDGDGAGGQQGNVWKFRFMPDQVGSWSYTYCWKQGSGSCVQAGSGSLNVVDTGVLPGPLKVGTDRSWYFMNARGQPFHWRGYGIHHFLNFTDTGRIATESGELNDFLQEDVIGRGYNFLMWLQMGDRFQQSSDTTSDGWADSWWLDPSAPGVEPDRNTFNIQTFRATEDALDLLKDNGVYVFNFAAFLTQGNQCTEPVPVGMSCSAADADPYPFSDFQVFLRYYMARFGAYYNFIGWSPSWEWMDIWTPAEVDQIMQYVYDIDPWKRLLSVHDNSYSEFGNWVGFSMRQKPGRDLFSGNDRQNGAQQIFDPDGAGGVGNPFVDKPIIGSEDIWESYQGISTDGCPNPQPPLGCYDDWDMPRNAAETRRMAWGDHLAGVLPLYTDYHIWTSAVNGGAGEPEVSRMFDFLHTMTSYRQYQQLNQLVSSSDGQIASGIPGQEYLVYDHDGGDIDITLTGASSSTEFSVRWYDPKNGDEYIEASIQGSGPHTLSPPSGLTGDTVVLLKAASGSGAPVDGLLIHHRYNDNSGTTAADSSGNGNSGQVNGASWVGGQIASALHFDGVDDYVSISSSQLGQISNELTVSAWVYLDSSSGVWKTAVSRQVGSSADEHYFLGFNGTHARFFVNTTAGYSDYESGVNVSAGQWHHLVGVYDGSNTRLYVNGQLGFTSAHSGTFASDTTPLIVGGNVNSSNGPVEERLDGSIDNLRIYTRAISAGEVSSLAGEANAGDSGSVAITAPSSGTVFSPGQSVTATGTGSNLTWSIDRIGDGLADFASGSGSSVTFTVPSDATTSQTILVKLTGSNGYAERSYAIGSGGGTVSITTPIAGTTFTPGQTVTATGTGSNLVWGIDRIGDGLPDFASGTGSSITFTVPSDATTSQTIQIKLSGTEGMADRTYAIGSSSGFNVTIDSVSTSQPYATTSTQTGALEFIDRSYTITSLSSNLNGGRLIRTANDDKFVTATSHLTFTVSAAASIYLVWDSRVDGVPAWLDGSWTLTSETYVSEGMGAADVYVKNVGAGQTTLGGTLASPAEAPANGHSHYTVIVKAQ
jgi:hypothetical protein